MLEATTFEEMIKNWTEMIKKSVSADEHLLELTGRPRTSDVSSCHHFGRWFRASLDWWVAVRTRRLLFHFSIYCSSLNEIELDSLMKLRVLILSVLINWLHLGRVHIESWNMFSTALLWTRWRRKGRLVHLRNAPGCPCVQRESFCSSCARSAGAVRENDRYWKCSAV